MNRPLAVFLFAAFAAPCPQSAVAGPITVPTDLKPGDQYRLVFVTSIVRPANLPNIADYNAFVTIAANSIPELVGLGTTWNVIGSTLGISARDNTATNPTISTGYPIYRLDSRLVARSNADLWDGTLINPINVAENGAPAIPGFQGIDWVFTGTQKSGIPAGFGQYLGNGNACLLGTYHSTDFHWVNDSIGVGGLTLKYYAMSGVLTVVPEPSTLALAAFGFIGLVAWGWQRKQLRAVG